MTYFPELRRPQYPSTPEVLLSALAWSVVPRLEAEDESLGLIYERFVAPKGLKIRQTKPKGPEVADFGEALAEHGIRSLGDSSYPEVGAAVANSLNGILPDKGKGRASSSIGIAAALLQDPMGGLSAKQPPNFAHLINTIYSLGDEGQASYAAGQWFSAARCHALASPLIGIERALIAKRLAGILANPDPWPPPAPNMEKKSEPSAAPTWWWNELAKAGHATPFQWFRVSWDRLCSPSWHQRLPPRRWTSWALCVLRHGLGFSFLWEANFYTELTRAVLSNDKDPATSAANAMVPVRPLLPYRRGSVSEMNVGSGINKALAVGLACREALEAALKGATTTATTLSDVIRILRERSDEELRNKLAHALTGPPGGSRLGNLQETVKYSLLARATQGDADHYGLLQTVSRNYAHVVPGAEWIVVMSAMAAPEPNSIVRLGDVMQGLRALGFQPRMDFLLAELERAGLCASAPDGDQGIEINLGFGRG